MSSFYAFFALGEQFHRSKITQIALCNSFHKQSGSLSLRSICECCSLIAMLKLYPTSWANKVRVHLQIAGSQQSTRGFPLCAMQFGRPEIPQMNMENGGNQRKSSNIDFFLLLHNHKYYTAWLRLHCHLLMTKYAFCPFGT